MTIATIRQSNLYKRFYFRFYLRRLFPLKNLPLNKKQKKYVLKKIDSEIERLETKWNDLFGGKRESSLNIQVLLLKEKMREELSLLRSLYCRIEANKLIDEDVSLIHSVIYKEDPALHSLHS
ncbi:hypothetical protein ABEV55_14645 [Aneurinibacillus thermoaerophilus]|uniref:hypothetical protein n=1 Tax=Aneurinibacillus thermoaerophilus TaxID=143495 RepID=UPI002E220177|nr:hypothetical protein [Aneurinibacillus thermoaerophilus]